MKRFSLIISIVIATFFIGCDSSLVDPNNTLTYNGNDIQDIEAPFVLEDQTLSSFSLDEIVPDGIIYGTVSNPENVYLAQGGEFLPSGVWIDNLSGSPLIGSAEENSVIIFAEPTQVTLLDPVDVLYLDINHQWHMAEFEMDAQVYGILTGASGRCSFTSTDGFGIGGEGSDNAVLSYFGIGGEGADNFGIGGEGADNALLAFGIGGEGADNFGIGGEGADNALLTYNGIPVATTPAPFLLNNQLAMGDLLTGTQVRLPLPAGTVYGHEDYPDQVFLAQGGEELPDGGWIDNSYEYAFVTDIYSGTQINFVELAYVLITEATLTQYQNANEEWVNVDGAASVWAKSIMTGVDGGCIIDTGVKYDIGGEGEYD